MCASIVTQFKRGRGREVGSLEEHFQGLPSYRKSCNQASLIKYTFVDYIDDLII